MNKAHTLPSNSSSLLARLLALGTLAATAAVSHLGAQTGYTVVDLSTAGGFDSAADTSAGVTVGSTATRPSLVTRAALWNGTTYSDLHPTALLGSSTTARSTATSVANGVQVGSGLGPNTSNRMVGLVWRGTAESAATLLAPFATYSTTALGTDGTQVVGSAIGFARDGTTTDAGHAMLWDLATGAVVDLGLSAQALGVAGGQQVGQIVKGTVNAALWRGTSKSLVVLHPKNATSSSAAATDGVRQVGTSIYDVRIRSEAANGNHNALFTYATVWSGTATSAIIIHDGRFRHTYATGVSGPNISGYGADNSALGTPAYYHALVWDANGVATDLNAFLPAGFVGSQALSVDSAGYVSGYMMTATGERHAVVWIPNL